MHEVAWRCLPLSGCLVCMEAPQHRRSGPDLQAAQQIAQQVATLYVVIAKVLLAAESHATAITSVCKETICMRSKASRII